MDPRKWAIYLGVDDAPDAPDLMDAARSFVEVFCGYMPADAAAKSLIVRQLRAFVEVFRSHLPSPARVIVPGARTDALVLAATGYDVTALVLRDAQSLREVWNEFERAGIVMPGHLEIVEGDAHDLDFPAGTFDGYFSVQFHEHLVAPHVHVGEVRHALRDGGIAFVDACGTTNEACRAAWHPGIVSEATLRDQWDFWGFGERWRGPEGDGRPQFVFEKLPEDHSAFRNGKTLASLLRARREYARRSLV